MSAHAAALGAIILVSLAAASPRAQSQTATVTTNAPLFVVPDANREPLIVAKAGSRLKLLKVDGDWCNVEFQDPQFGRRVAYVQKRNLRLDSPVPTPVDVSVSDAVQPTAGDSRRDQHDTPGNQIPAVQAAARAMNPVSVTRTPSLKDIRRVYVEKMPNDLDQYIAAEVTKQLKGRLLLVLQKDSADAILRGTGEKKDGVGAAITGRYLGLHDNATGSISLVDKDETAILWSSEAGDRSLMWGVMARGGPRKVATRLVSDLKKALQNAQ